MGITKKMTSFLLIMVLVFGTALPISAAFEPEARVINVLNVLGDDVTLSRAPGGRSISPRSGQGLNDGNVLATGRDSYVYMHLDGISILKMDETSRVQVNATRNLLSLSVQAGAALVEVDQQQPGHSLEVLVGSTAFGVRGTSFIIGRRPAVGGDSVFVTMLSGEGEMRITNHLGEATEVTVPAGAMLVVYEDRAAVDVTQTHTIRYDFDVAAMGLFELREIYARYEQLLESGVLTPDMAAELPGLILQREAEREAQWAQIDNWLLQIAQAMDTGIQTFEQAQAGDIAQGAQVTGVGGRVYLDELVQVGGGGYFTIHPLGTGLSMDGVAYPRGISAFNTSGTLEIAGQGFTLLSGVFGYVDGRSGDGSFILNITLLDSDGVIDSHLYRIRLGEPKIAVNIPIAPEVHFVRIGLVADSMWGDQKAGFANAFFTTDPNDITVLGR